MALTNYGELRAAVVDWILSLSGGGLTAAIVASDILPQVQSMMYHGDGIDIQPLRIRAMVSSATITPATGGIITISSQVDAGWLEFIELVPSAVGSVSLDYVEPWEFRKQSDKLVTTTGPQAIYTIEGDSVFLAPKAVTTIDARWYEKFTALSDDSDTDWVLTNAPQVYMNGCLMLAADYVEDQRGPMFRSKFAAAIRALNMNDSQQRASGSIPVARPRSVV